MPTLLPVRACPPVSRSRTVGGQEARVYGGGLASAASPSFYGSSTVPSAEWERNTPRTVKMHDDAQNKMCDGQCKMEPRGMARCFSVRKW